ncbi:MAG: hypothetical protein HN392_04550 [Anaerolineae bacterium]|nr:hypothetical protein [Anaerolineae bacterium]MBT7075700.1 hypothetical protein [Anaerolineae bacterium]MBT7781935.1 hypothetical protein [Anaerolineae bacterium]
MKKKSKLTILISFSFFTLLILACSLPGMATTSPSEDNEDAIQTAIAETHTALALVAPPVNATAGPSVAPALTATPVHLLIPGEPPSYFESHIIDRNSLSTAPKHAANGGENFDTNLYERPFNATTMDIYYPDLDIIKARLDRTGAWVYIEIEMVNVNPSDGIMGGNYGVELDLDVDGRGDWLVLASKPTSTWSTLGVRVWQDTDNDVGNDFPTRSDPPQQGNGYDMLYFNQGNNPDADIAWARISPKNPKVIQIAFKPSLIASDNYFMWGAWADQGVFKPEFYDYNDHFTHAEAGSPLPGLQKYYPLKALFEVDNTCREAVGFTLTGEEPASCLVYIPPTETQIPTTIPVTPTATLRAVQFWSIPS